MRSPRLIPRPAYRLAMFTTRRRLLRTICSRACGSLSWMTRWLSSHSSCHVSRAAASISLRYSLMVMSNVAMATLPPDRGLATCCHQGSYSDPLLLRVRRSPEPRPEDFTQEAYRPVAGPGLAGIGAQARPAFRPHAASHYRWVHLCRRSRVPVPRGGWEWVPDCGSVRSGVG